MQDKKSLQDIEEEQEPANVCPDCGSTEIEHENEERYCKKCGLVFE